MNRRVETTPRDMIFLKRVLSRLLLHRSDAHGTYYFDIYSSPLKIQLVNNSGRVVGSLDVAQIEAIVREEGQLARSLASAC